MSHNDAQSIAAIVHRHRFSGALDEAQAMAMEYYYGIELAFDALCRLNTASLLRSCLSCRNVHISSRNVV